MGARAVVCPINTRLKPAEVAYILEHSQSKLILVDHEYMHLVQGARAPIIVNNDNGKAGDTYEEFLSGGRVYSAERGWQGLEWNMDEDSPIELCYTWVLETFLAARY